MKGQANQAAGTVREKVGDATGNEGMEQKGREQHAKGDAQEAGGKVKGAVKDAGDAVKDTADKVGDKIKDATGN
ncbi:MAG: CsbD family protein [Tepidiformaceae bacterium]